MEIRGRHTIAGPPANMYPPVSAKHVADVLLVPVFFFSGGAVGIVVEGDGAAFDCGGGLRDAGQGKEGEDVDKLHCEGWRLARLDWFVSSS